VRFSKGNDPDPMRSKFHNISGIEDLPEEYRKMHEDMLTHATGIAEQAQKDRGCTEAGGVMSFVAFQSVQIASLQEEIKVLYRALEAIATEVDKKQDK